MFSYTSKGIRIDEHDLYLDATKVVPFSFISHGHGDHLRNHKTIIATPPTIEFFKIRFAQRVKKPKFIPLNFLEPMMWNGMKITLYPAGHILGSAMILLETEETSLLYTGDFKLQPSRTAETIKIPQADILIMESTYGIPVYRFSEDRTKIPGKLSEIITEIRESRCLPVVLAYSLGKAQEAMAFLAEMGDQVLVHQSAWKLTDVYKNFGHHFDHCKPFNGSADPNRDILIIPPHLEKQLWENPVLPYKTIFLSGWAIENRSVSFRRHADYSLPLSDHADFADLITFVRQVNPEMVYTLHGFPEFADHLRAEGFDAEFLADHN